RDLLQSFCSPSSPCHLLLFLFFSMIRFPPISPLFPYTTLFRSHVGELLVHPHGDRRLYLLPNHRHGLCRGPHSVGVESSAAAKADRKSTRLNPVTVASRMPSSA